MTAKPLNLVAWGAILVAVGAAVPYAPGADLALRCAGALGPALWPDLGSRTVAWFAVVLILGVSLRLRPVNWKRNLDALVLAAMGLLLVIRSLPAEAGTLEQTWRSSAYLGLTITTAYWLLRGIETLWGRRLPPHTGNVSPGVLLMLVVAGLAISAHQLATAPLSPGSRDGIVGGVFTAENGALPYGDTAGHDHRSPLLYLVHAGVLQAAHPLPATEEAATTPESSGTARAPQLQERWPADTLETARLVNAVLFLALLSGLYVIGRRLHSSASSWTLIAIFCVFPGTLECLPRPEIMLAAAALTWSLAAALLPGIGGLLGTLLLVVAGVAWPWAWLGLPVMLAYFWRCGGWRVLGSSVGLLGGVALSVWGLISLVQPTLPQTDGALTIAGLPPAFDARLTEGTLVVDRRTPAEGEPESLAVSAYLWRPLVKSESLTVEHVVADGQEIKVNWPNSEKGLYREVRPAGDALPVLQNAYRAAVGQLPAATRVLVAARTVLEATWPLAWSQPPPVTGSWQVWSGSDTAADRTWVQLHRLAKLVMALAAVLTALLIFFGQRTQPRHLIGGLLVVASGALIASELGAATNLVWLLPLVLTLWAVHEPPEEKPAPAAVARLAQDALPAAPPEEQAERPGIALVGGDLSPPPPAESPSRVPFTSAAPPRISVDDKPGEKPAD